MLKNIALLLYTNFYISLNALRRNFFHLYNLSFLRSPNIGKIRVKDGPKSFFSLIHSQQRDKQNRARDFLVSKYFLNNLLLTVFIYNTLSKLVELLQ